MDSQFCYLLTSSIDKCWKIPLEYKSLNDLKSITNRKDDIDNLQLFKDYFRSIPKFRIQYIEFFKEDEYLFIFLKIWDDIYFIDELKIEDLIPFIKSLGVDILTDITSHSHFKIRL